MTSMAELNGAPEGETTAQALERLRAAIEAESISWGEIAELQSLAQEIEPGDVVLLEWAGVPESQAYVEKGKRNLDADDESPHGTCPECGQPLEAGDTTVEGYR